MEDALKKSPVFDYEKGEFVFDGNRVKTVQGAEALKEILTKAIGTERGVYTIYADPDDETKNHKYGNDAVLLITRRELSEAAQQSEVKRATKEAVIYDPWVKDAYNIRLEKNGTDSYSCSADIDTIFDEVVTVGGVVVNYGH
jgi:hypothetical protein